MTALQEIIGNQYRRLLLEQKRLRQQVDDERSALDRLESELKAVDGRIASIVAECQRRDIDLSEAMKERAMSEVRKAGQPAGVV